MSRAGVTRRLLIGLAAVVPFWITVVVVLWIAGLIEGAVGRWVALTVPPPYYVPGFGVAVGLAVIWALGLVLDHAPGRRALETVEQGLDHIPIVRSVYGTTRDLMTYLVDAKTNRRKRSFNKVVAVRIGDGHTRLIGLVTREDIGELNGDLNVKQAVMVYLPMSYQLGGYTIIVPRSAIELVDMSVEDAIRLTMTAGVSAEPGTTRAGPLAAPAASGGAAPGKSASRLESAPS